jgi:ribosomal protein L37AE/L43A
MNNIDLFLFKGKSRVIEYMQVLDSCPKCGQDMIGAIEEFAECHKCGHTWELGRLKVEVSKVTPIIKKTTQ